MVLVLKFMPKASFENTIEIFVIFATWFDQIGENLLDHLSVHPRILPSFFVKVSRLFYPVALSHGVGSSEFSRASISSVSIHMPTYRTPEGGREREKREVSRMCQSFTTFDLVCATFFQERRNKKILR